MTLTDWAYQWASTPEDARAGVWRARRIDVILAGETPHELTNNPTIVIHILPGSAFNNSIDLPVIDIEQLAQVGQVTPSRTRTNVDGIVAVSREDPAYIQVFRDGIVEYANSELLAIPGTSDLNGGAFAEFLSPFLRLYQQRILIGGQDEERQYGVSLLHVKGRGFANTGATLGFDRDVVMIPFVKATETGVAASAIRRLVKQANGALE